MGFFSLELRTIIHGQTFSQYPNSNETNRLNLEKAPDEFMVSPKFSVTMYGDGAFSTDVFGKPIPLVYVGTLGASNFYGILRVLSSSFNGKFKTIRYSITGIPQYVTFVICKKD